MKTIIITGGSGFIGTNLVDLFSNRNWNVINYDIVPPRNSDHNFFWRKIDIMDSVNLKSNFERDNPQYIVHLAARTDLNEKIDIHGYDVNITGVENVMHAALNLNSLKRIVVSSSMLVCELGFIQKSIYDYCPNTFYGESKVLTEKIVLGFESLDWVLVRPTSIWGPWFGEPYFNFFELVIKRLFLNISSDMASVKTFGYVKITCRQIEELLISDKPEVIRNCFYLGDLMPLNISEWANEIRKLNMQSKPLTIPGSLIRFFALIGDILKDKLGFRRFPINSFRYRNMTTDNIIPYVSKTVELTGVGGDTDIKNCIIETLAWIKSQK